MLSRVEYRLMESEAEREEVYRLRYRAYLHESAVAPNAEHERIEDKFDHAPNSWIFGLYFDGEPHQFDPHQRVDARHAG